MSQNRDDGENGNREGRELPNRSGSEDLQFLDLEMSKVLVDEASGLARKALQEALVEKIRGRLMERLGELIDGLADAAVEDLASDIEANLDIERRIRERAETRLRQEKVLENLFKSGPVDDD